MATATFKDYGCELSGRQPLALFIVGCSPEFTRSIQQQLTQHSAFTVVHGPYEYWGSSSAFAVVLGEDAATPEAVRSVKAQGGVPICVLLRSEANSLRQASRLVLAGAQCIIEEEGPARLSKLLSVTARISDRLTRDDRSKGTRLDALLFRLGIVAKSPASIAMFRQVERVASVGSFPVLISGETGTGKELVARAIHALDATRCDEGFIALNAAAMNAQLAESELFGHRRGAFTGAERDRLGLFRAADGGVLFLDEIGELNLDLQAKLLRVLQERSVLPLGTEEEVRVNVRVVAATNRDLRKMVRSGEFRDDLYHRLNGMLVAIPPLRERTEDIAPLVHHFLSKNAGLSAPFQAHDADEQFFSALQQSRLEGNVRQVENAVVHALLSLDRSRPLEIGDLPDEILEELAGQSGTPGVEPAPASSQTRSSAVQYLEENAWNFGRSVQAFEQGLASAAVELCGGNQTLAARRLGITRRSLFTKLRGWKDDLRPLATKRLYVST